MVLFTPQIFQVSGDPLDGCSMAMFAALQLTTIPKTDLILNEANQAEDFEISGDLSESVPLPILNLPILITVYKVSHWRTMCVMQCLIVI